MRASRLPAIALVGVVFAGCAMPSALRGSPGEDAFGLVCAATSCVIAQPGDDAAFREPSLAVDGRDPSRMALAATLDLPRAIRSAGMSPGSESPNLCAVVVLTTSDGGGQWIRSEPPLAPLPELRLGPVRDRCARSPSITFDDAGHLHLVVSDSVGNAGAAGGALAGRTGAPGVLAAATEPFAEVVSRVTYARSTDGGMSWNDASVLHGNSNHPHIAFEPSARRLVATLRDFEGDGFRQSLVFWSDDGGVTWRNASVPCHLPSPPVLDAHRALFACNDHSAMPAAMVAQVWRLGMVTLDVSLVASRDVPGAQNLFTSLDRTRDGTLALAWTPTIRGGAVDGNAFLAFAPAETFNFDEALDLTATADAGAASAGWALLAGGDQRVESWLLTTRGETVSFHRVSVEERGATGESVKLDQWTPPPYGPDSRLLGEHPGPGYPGVARAGDALLVVHAVNDERALKLFAFR